MVVGEWTPENANDGSKTQPHRGESAYSSSARNSPGSRGGGGYNLELNWDVALQEHKPTGDRPREVDDPTFSLVSKQPTSPSNSQVV